MGWYKTVLVIIAYGGLVQLINWTFTSLRLDENVVEVLPFLLSNIIAVLIILIILVAKLQRKRGMI